MEKAYYEDITAKEWMAYVLITCILNIVIGKLHVLFFIVTLIVMALLIYMKKKWKINQTKKSKLFFITYTGKLWSLLLLISWTRICYFASRSWVYIVITVIMYACVLITAIMVTPMKGQKEKRKGTKIIGAVEAFALGGSLFGFGIARSMSKNVSQNQAYLVIGLCIYIIALLTGLFFLGMVSDIKEVINDKKSLSVK